MERYAEEARADPTLGPAERTTLANRFDADAAIARSASSARRAALSRRIIGSDNSIKMSSGDHAAARLALTDTPTLTDEVWVAVQGRNWDDVLALVTKAWARGQMDDLLRTAAKPGEDVFGIAVRPAFNLFTSLSRMAGTLPYRRIMALARADVSDARRDAKRGVARIYEEMKEGDTGSDLGPIVDLLGHHDLTSQLRSDVLEAFVAFEADDGVSKSRETTPAKFFLDRMARHFEGDTSNWERLRDLLEPAKTAAEQRERARDVRAAAHRGRYSSIAQGAAHAWGVVSGDYLYEAEARAEDRLEYIRTASDEQLAPLLEAAGVKTPTNSPRSRWRASANGIAMPRQWKTPARR